MKSKSKAGIQNKDKRKHIADQLCTLLANTYTLYLKTQNFHWNVTGENFYSLHLLFEKQYEDLAEAIDVIAERIRALGFPTPASFSEFNRRSFIKEAGTQLLAATKMIQQLKSDHDAIAASIRDLCAQAEEAEDAASADLVTQRLQEHEKAAWMLGSMLE